MKSVITFILASVFCISIHAQAQKPKYIFCVLAMVWLGTGSVGDAYLREQARVRFRFVIFLQWFANYYSLSSKITCSAAALCNC
jgi:hypothetical protein